MRMPTHYHERFEGPIRGLRLPLATWNSLQNEGITTLDELTAVADRLEQLVGIGPKLAQMIRDELARLAAAEQQPSDNA
jgi:DNA-directed RNA polymerase alpha subunit